MLFVDESFEFVSLTRSTATMTRFRKYPLPCVIPISLQTTMESLPIAINTTSTRKGLKMLSIEE